MPQDIFISYSSVDSAVANTVCSILEGRGMGCWIAPRDITPGIHWGEAIINAINKSRAMVVLFSSSANKSQQVLREVERAVSKGLAVVPFRIEPVLPSKAMEYFLSSPHWFNALTPPLDAHVDKLHLLLQSILAAPRTDEPIWEYPITEQPIPDSDTSAPDTKAIEKSIEKLPTPPPAPKKKLKRDERDSRISEASQSITQVIHRGLALATAIEKNDADKPLARHFEGLGDEAKNLRLSIILLGLDSHSRETFLGRLFKEPVFFIPLPPEAEVVEIHFRENGYGLAGPDKKFAEFDDFHELTKAIKAWAASEGPKDSCYLEVAAPTELRGATILIPRGLSLIAESPVVLTSLVSRSSLAVVPGKYDTQLSAEERQFLMDVCSASDVIWPIVTHKKKEKIPAEGWWNDAEIYGDEIVLPHLALTVDGEPSQPKVVSDPNYPLRDILQLHHLSRRLWRSAAMIFDVLSQRQRQLTNKQLTARRQLGVLEPAQAKEKAAAVTAGGTEVVLATGKEEILKLAKSIEELNSRAFAGGGRAVASLKDVVNTMELQDVGIVTEEGKPYVKIVDQFVDKVMVSVQDVMQHQLDSDVTMLKDGLEHVSRTLSAELTKARGLPVPVSLSIPALKDMQSLANPTQKLITGYKGKIGSGGSGVISTVGSSVGKIAGRVDKRVEKELPQAKFTLAWEAQLFVRDLIQQKVTLLSKQLFELANSLEASFGGQKLGGAAQPAAAANDTEARRQTLTKTIQEYDGQLRELESRSQDALEFQQSCADVESLCRSLMRNVVESAEAERA